MTHAFHRQENTSVLRDLGIVCQTGSTGGMRYSAMLAKAMKTVAPHVCVTLYHGKSLDISDIREPLRVAGVRLRRLGRTPRATTRIAPDATVLQRAWAACRSAFQWQRSVRLNRILRRHQVVHCAWPYGMDPPQLDIPLTFIPHDFIHSHEFGVLLYDARQWADTQASLGKWLARGYPIVSSDFVARELAQAFPAYEGPVSTVYLSSLHPRSTGFADAGRAEATCRRLGIAGRYILCPNNVMPHKNLGVLIGALWHIRQRGEDVRLVVVGPGTDGIRATVACPLYGDRVDDQTDWHIRGFGLVSESDLTDLMLRAAVVANPSLCEAGTGSGLDAWGLGCPVALADIPAFRDQVRVLGTPASFFDPRDSKDAARAILGMIRDPGGTAAAAETARKALERYTWDKVAEQYRTIFESLLNSGCRSSHGSSTPQATASGRPGDDCSLGT